MRRRNSGSLQTILRNSAKWSEKEDAEYYETTKTDTEASLNSQAAGESLMPSRLLTWKNYDIAFDMYTPVHEKKIISMRMQDLQDCITAKSNKSQSTVGNMRTIVPGNVELCSSQ